MLLCAATQQHERARRHNAPSATRHNGAQRQEAAPPPTLLLWQLLQLQDAGSQCWPDAKHSQYSFRQREFLQLHWRGFIVATTTARALLLVLPRVPVWP
jgi:hypothetical protein